MENETRPQDRQLDLAALKALSHPLRTQLLDLLSIYGPATATALAERLDESSGATSYHLRQLEKHGFVMEDADRGTGRERWWKRVPGSITINTTGLPLDAPEVHAGRVLSAEWQRQRDRLLQEYFDRGHELGDDWMRASTISTMTLRLTQPQAKEFADDLMGLLDSYAERYRGQDVPGSRPVQVQLNYFPLVSGTETPETPGDVGGAAETDPNAR